MSIQLFNQPFKSIEQLQQADRTILVNGLREEIIKWTQTPKHLGNRQIAGLESGEEIIKCISTDEVTSTLFGSNYLNTFTASFLTSQDHIITATSKFATYPKIRFPIKDVAKGG